MLWILPLITMYSLRAVVSIIPITNDKILIPFLGRDFLRYFGFDVCSPRWLGFIPVSPLIQNFKLNLIKFDFVSKHVKIIVPSYHHTVHHHHVEKVHVPVHVPVPVVKKVYVPVETHHHEPIHHEPIAHHDDWQGGWW